MTDLPEPRQPEPPASAGGDLSALKASLFRARATLVEASPFLGSLVLKVPILITDDPRVRTACVDGRGVCTFSRTFLEALPMPTLRGILLHETLHLALDAFPRCGGRKALRWNIAHDYAINLLIAGSDFPPDFLNLTTDFSPLLDARFQGLSAEDIYALLPGDLGELGLGDGLCVEDAVQAMTRAQKSALARAILDGFDLSAWPGETRQRLREALAKLPERLRGPLPDDPGAWDLDRLRALFPLGAGPEARRLDLWFDLWEELTAEARQACRDSWRERLLEAAEAALSGGRGIADLPLWAQKLLGPLLNPQVPWQVLLAQRIHGRLRGRRRSFARPGRRSQSVGVTLPGPFKDRGAVGVFVDVSGSVGPRELGAFMGELAGILRDAEAAVRLITWDTEVMEDLCLEHPEDIQTAIQDRTLALKGGGGTDPRCVIERLASGEGSDQPPIGFGILLTDGLVPWPNAREWPLDLLVVCTACLPEPAYGYDALRIHTGADHA